MTQPLDIASISAAIGEPARAKMLVALLGGKALTASELALEADITAQTATTHLQKLLTNRLVSLERQGRHKYFRLLNFQVAQLLEQMLSLTADSVQLKTQTGPADIDMRRARVCYDHLAGEKAVQLFEHLVQSRLIKSIQHNPTLSQAGIVFFNQLGAPVDALLRVKRPLCKTCLDWSERRYHLAGSLGKWILQDLYVKKWAVKDMDSRVIHFSEKGIKRFSTQYQM